MEFSVEGAVDVFKGYQDSGFFTASEQVCVCGACMHACVRVSINRIQSCEVADSHFYMYASCTYPRRYAVGTRNGRSVESCSFKGARSWTAAWLLSTL